MTSSSTADDWSDAFGAVEPGTSHNAARDQIWEDLLEILGDRIGDEAPPHLIRRALQQNDDLRSAFNSAWPVLDPAGVVADLWSAPAYLRRCAPSLDGVRHPDSAAQRSARLDGRRTFRCSTRPACGSAIPRRRGARAGRRLCSRRSAERWRRSSTTCSSPQSSTTARGSSRCCARRACRTRSSTSPRRRPSTRTRSPGPFAHIVIDEAQELTDAEWQMLLRRCPSRSFTIVGDRAQARHGFAESWAERLERDRARPRRGGDADHQLPHAGGGHGRGRAGHPGGPPRRERADVDPQQRHPGRTRVGRRAGARSSRAGSPSTPRGSPPSSAMARPCRPA